MSPRAWLFLQLLLVAFAAPLPLTAQEDGARAYWESRQALAKACVAQIPSLQQDRPLAGWQGARGDWTAARDLWARCSTGTDLPEDTEAGQPVTAPLDQTLRAIGDLPVIAVGERCEGAAPGGQAAICGSESGYLVDGLPQGIIRIPLGEVGGRKRCGYYLPIQLSDKRSGFACNAIRTRIACVKSIAEGDGRTVVTLAASREANAATESIVVSHATAAPADEAQIGRIPFSADNRTFMLVRARLKFRGVMVNTAAALLAEMDRSRQDCMSRRAGSADGTARCARAGALDAERLLQEFARKERSPQWALSYADRAADRNGFYTSMARTDPAILPLQKEARDLYHALVVNEIGFFPSANGTGGSPARSDEGTISPYQVIDAVIGMSGPSFGAKQIDLATNGGADEKMFHDIVRNNLPSGDIPIGLQACFQLPGRFLSVEQLHSFYASLALANSALRSENGRVLHDEGFRTFLNTRATLASRLGGAFQKSLFLRLYYGDQDNHKGPAKAKLLKTAGESIALSPASTCTDVQRAEKTVLDEYARAYPDALREYRSRVDNIYQYLSGFENCARTCVPTGPPARCGL